MKNASILAAFERMWQHVILALNSKAEVYSGTTVPSNSLGKDGDIYIMYSNQ